LVRGQRELIIGDRQTGKTAVAIDAIINQKYTHTEEAKAMVLILFIVFTLLLVKKIQQ
jgi:F0F1-type ATP synthase alpha subunit